jgi:hypothetical protein
MKLFRAARPVVGVVHLLPLPGSPRARGMEDVLRRALRDARALAGGGADGIIVENYGDLPFAPGPVDPHVPAVLAVVAREVRRAAGLPVGINVLRNDARSALGAAVAAGASFIRVNVHVGAARSGEGRLVGRAHETLRYRRALGSSAAIFADVFVKHARPVGRADVRLAARETAYRGLADVLLVTGPETGGEADVERVRAVRRAVPDRPVYVASGVTLENAEAFREADGFIVGTAFKEGRRTEAPVDPRRVRALIKALRAGGR